MRKAVITAIGIILIIFSIFMIVNAQNPPPIPIQVFGSVTPTIPDGHVIYFIIEDLEFASSNIVSSGYGSVPLLFLPTDDLGTPDKEGYDSDDTVEIYIDSVKVVEVLNLTHPYEEINIQLTTSQYNSILGIQPQQQQQTSPGGGGGGGGGCFYRWNCSEWGDCLPNGTTIKFCKNTGTCYPYNKTFAKDCVYIPPVTGEDEEEEPVEPEPEAPAEIPEPKKSLSWLLYTIIIVVVAGGLGFAVYEVKRSHRSLQQEMKQPRLDPQSHENLKNYIKNTIEMGYTRDQIRKELSMEGWSPKILRKVFAEV